MGVGTKDETTHIYVFFSHDFKILSYLLPIIEFINHIHYCIRIDIIMVILIFLFLHIFNFYPI